MVRVSKLMISDQISREGAKARSSGQSEPGSTFLFLLRAFAPSRETKSRLIHRILLFLALATSLQASSTLLHQTSFDGGLYWSRTIISMWIADGLPLHVMAYHQTKTNSFENSASSSWKILGLETWLVCDEKNKLAWHSPAGTTVFFNRDQALAQGSVKSEGCELTIVSEDEYVVTDDNSRKWVYNRGSLARVHLANGGTLSFKCSNGLIREITNKNEVLLNIEQQGRALLLYARQQKIATVGYDTTGRLIESITFEDTKRPSLKFTYKNGNLTAITEGDEVAHTFVWKKVGFLKRGLTLLLYPCYLYSDGRHTYSHGFYFGVAKMTATDASGVCETKTYNLKTRAITDRK